MARGEADSICKFSVRETIENHIESGAYYLIRLNVENEPHHIRVRVNSCMDLQIVSIFFHLLISDVEETFCYQNFKGTSDNTVNFTPTMDQHTYGVIEFS